ncbi:MAG: DUF5668 domain-containing protein [Candidatus Zixiibacteriota bacterium]
MNPARFRWGILFILAGVLLILHNFRYMDWWAWERIGSLWPLLLIAIGVEKIFAQTKVQFISYLAPVALAAIIVFVAVGGGVDENLRTIGSISRYNLEMKPEYKSLTLDFALDNDDLSLQRTSTSDLVRCRFGGDSRAPGIELDDDGGDVTLRLDEGKGPRRWIRINSGHRSSNRWSAGVNGAIPVTLKLTGDKADMRIDGRELDIRELLVDSESGDVNISIGSAADLVKVKLQGDQADFTITVPRTSGIKVVNADESIFRRFSKIGLIENTDGYISEGYDTLSPKIELDLSSDIRQFSLDYD